MWPRFLKLGLYGSAVAFGGTAVVSVTVDDYNTLSGVRIMRTACTAYKIGRVYQSKLYSREWDKTSKEYFEVKSQAHQIGAEKLLELCQTNKGAYIKIGQHVGALDYLLPPEYVNTMRILHKDAPKNTLEQLYRVIRTELKKEPEELFDSFEPEPLGTASLAQVHKAKLKSGEEVAVKVQHYFVRQSIDIDLKWIEIVVNILSRVFPEFEMQWLVDETKKNIKQELNFLNEGKNAERVAEMFKNYSWLKVPRIYWDYSSERVLVMEYVNGGQVNDTNYIKKNNINREDICRKLGDLYSHMIFVNGFVHSDPHPGNILISNAEDPKNTSVYLLDHGLYAELTPTFRYNYSKLWLSIINRDKEDMAKYSQELGIRKELFGLFSVMVSGRPWDTIMKGIDRTKRTDAERTLFQEELPQFINLISECLEHVDRQALLVLKTNDLIRSIEYALGLQDKQCGFIVMTKCCFTSVYQHDAQSATGIRKHLIGLKYRWSLFMIYLYGIYLGLINKVSI